MNISIYNDDHMAVIDVVNSDAQVDPLDPQENIGLSEQIGNSERGEYFRYVSELFPDGLHIDAAEGDPDLIQLVIASKYFQFANQLPIHERQNGGGESHILEPKLGSLLTKEEEEVFVKLSAAYDLVYEQLEDTDTSLEMRKMIVERFMDTELRDFLCTKYLHESVKFLIQNMVNEEQEIERRLEEERRIQRTFLSPFSQRGYGYKMSSTEEGTYHIAYTGEFLKIVSASLDNLFPEGIGEQTVNGLNSEFVYKIIVKYIAMQGHRDTLKVMHDDETSLAFNDKSLRLSWNETLSDLGFEIGRISETYGDLIAVINMADESNNFGIEDLKDDSNSSGVENTEDEGTNDVKRGFRGVGYITNRERSYPERVVLCEPFTEEEIDFMRRLLATYDEVSHNLYLFMGLDKKDTTHHILMQSFMLNEVFNYLTYGNGNISEYIRMQKETELKKVERQAELDRLSERLEEYLSS